MEKPKIPLEASREKATNGERGSHHAGVAYDVSSPAAWHLSHVKFPGAVKRLLDFARSMLWSLLGSGFAAT
jgi:hypothetical protein